jgi:lipopolysaccharide transport system ATP-binding protein
MNDIAIRVEHLSKQYHIGGKQAAYQTFREALIETAAAPLRWLKGERAEKNLFWALDDVSFDIKHGEAVGIIGRNGAGKSTLLKILSSITTPTRGRVELYGRVGSLLEVGTGFHPELSGRENIFLNGAILGMSRVEIQGKFDEIVDFSGVEQFLDTPVKHYSSGMYVRLAFAVAAHLEPEILVVDEVLAVGDAEFQKKCLGKMSDVASGGRTVLFVSHNIPAVLRLCPKSILLDKGRLLRQGNSPDVVNYYLDSNQYNEGAVNWMTDDAPGDDDVKLLGVRMVDDTGVSKSVVEITERHFLRIRYSTSKPALKFRCSVKFRTQGVVAFVTMAPSEQEHDRSGIYESYVEIPANLLSEGEYSLSMSIFSSSGSKKRHVLVKDFFSFQVADYMKTESARGDYAQNFPGVVRPYLKWMMDYQGPVKPE